MAETDKKPAYADIDETVAQPLPTDTRPLWVILIAAAIAMFHLWANIIGTLSEIWMGALHLASFGVLCAILYPSGSGIFSKLWDYFIAACVVAGAIYIILFEDALYLRGVVFNQTDWLFAILTIFAAIELTRRTTGWFIPGMILVSLTYVFLWGPYAPGVFQFAGLSLETTLFRSYFSSEGMFATISRISWTYVFMFILFGAFLIKSGADVFIINLARIAAGKLVGGSGFVAVMASGMMGSVSGSSVANTMSTGIITIPLMKRAGFPRRFAAGVEAAASTGGQLMPPVMGAGAFIMASYTQLSYLDIIAAAALPAILYFLSVGYFVRIEAKKHNLHIMDDALPRFRDVMAEGWQFILPMAALVWMLVIGFTPTFAAGYAILAVIAASWLKLFNGKKGMTLKDIFDAFSLGAFNATTMAVLLTSIGLVVNVISMTGVGNTVSLMISQWADGSLLILFFLVAIASLILGMGLPVTAAYIVLATLSAPALYGLMAEANILQQMVAGTLPEAARGMFLLTNPDAMTLLASPMPYAQAVNLLDGLPVEISSSLYQLAIDPVVLSTLLLSAHMIIFWLSQDSNVTPPVCLTAFAAASIAGSKPMATGFMSWKLAKGLYIVPLLIAYTPFLGTDVYLNMKIFFFSALGIYCLAAALEGYAETSLSIFWRGAFVVAGALLLYPHMMLSLYIAGTVVMGISLYFTREIKTSDNLVVNG